MRLALAALLMLASSAPWRDADGDGIPDAAELTTAADRSAFRRWFVAIAAAQAVRPSPRWNPKERDCAGLVRFAYREALRGREDALVPSQPFPGPAISAWRYPDVPGLGADVFVVPIEVASAGRVRVTGKLGHSAFASARVLAEYDAHRVSRSVEDALPGDLLFFENEDDPEMDRHVMIVGKGGLSGWVVYHTGPIENGPGRVKVVDIAELARHPDPRWHPVPQNPAFLGVYRWNLIE